MPTSIDGVDISDASVDGQSIQEITAGGDVVWKALTAISSKDWSTGTLDSFSIRQKLLNGVLLVGHNGDGTVRAIDAGDGSQLWSETLSGGNVNYIAQDGNYFFVGTGDSGEIKAYQPDGTGVWNNTGRSRHKCSSRPGWNYVYNWSSNESPEVQALNPSDRSQEFSFSGATFNQDWVSEDPGASRVCRTENQSSGVDEHMNAYDFTGSQLWDITLDDRCLQHYPYNEQDDVYAITRSGTTYRIRGNDGAVIWSDSISAAGDRFVDYNSDGVFACFDDALAHYDHSGNRQWVRNNASTYSCEFTLIDSEQQIIFMADGVMKQVDYTDNSLSASVDVSTDMRAALLDGNSSNVVGNGNNTESAVGVNYG